MTELRKYTTIGAMYSSKDANGMPYIKVDNFYGDLVYRDKATGKEVPVSFIKLGTKRDGEPDFVQASVYITLEQSPGNSGQLKQRNT